MKKMTSKALLGALLTASSLVGLPYASDALTLEVPAALVPYQGNAISAAYLMLSMPQDATITSISIINSGISCSSPPSGFNSLLNPGAPGQYYIDLSQLPYYCPGVAPSAWQSGVNLAINISGTDVSTSNVNADGYALINGVGVKRLPSYFINGGSQPGNVQLVVSAALVPDNNAIHSSYVMLSMPQDATITSISIINSGISCSSPPSGFNSLLHQTATGQYYIDLSQLPSYCPGLTPTDWQSGVDLAINISGTDVSTSNVGADAYSNFVFGLKRSPVKVVQGNNSSSQSTFSTNIYQGTDHINEPIITVYIDGQPVKLVADTGHSGLIVNSSAVNIPSSDIDSSYTFSVGSNSGVMASATVCLNPSVTNSCVVMPIGVAPPNYFFLTTSEAQGYFGLQSDSGLDSLDIGYNSSGSSITGLSYPTYLERQYGINSYTISFYPLSNGYYSDVSSTTPIGQISFGVYNGNSNTLIPYTITQLVLGSNTFVIYPSTTVIFSSSTSSFTSYATFDSSFWYNSFNTSVFQTEIPNFSQSADEDACGYFSVKHDIPPGMLNGGFVISYTLQNNSGSFQTESFTTEPSLSFCEADIPFTLMKDVTIDYGSPVVFGETFGLPAMIGHTFTFVLGTSGTNKGFIQDIGISP